MKHGKGRMWQYIKDFDYLGAFLLILGMLLFLMGISWGGALHPWKSAHVISTIVIGFLLLVAFVLYEIYMPLKEPLVPMELFKNRTWNICIILWALGASVYYANAILWPTMVFTLYAPSHSSDLWPGWASCLSGSAVVFGELCVPIGALFPKKTRQISVTFIIGSAFVAGKFFILDVFGKKRDLINQLYFSTRYLQSRHANHSIRSHRDWICFHRLQRDCKLDNRHHRNRRPAGDRHGRRHCWLDPLWYLDYMFDVCILTSTSLPPH